MDFLIVLYKFVKGKAEFEAIVLSHSLLLLSILCLIEVLGSIFFVGFNQGEFCALRLFVLGWDCILEWDLLLVLL